MENLTNEFARRISAFLRETDLSPSEFGERAVGDRSFLGDLRRGRSPKLATVDRVLAFMAHWRRVHGPGASGDPSAGPGRGHPGGSEPPETGERKR